MKLITNFKDYYDWVIGKYGVDEKCVYERINSYNPNFQLETYRSFTIHFCNMMFCGHYYNGRFYYGNDAKNYIPSKIKDKFGYVRERGRCMDALDFTISKDKFAIINSKNEELGCPVVLDGRTKNIKLSDFQFAKVMPPEQAFLLISNFITKGKAIVDNQTNNEKIISNGFDTKTSFRPKIKTL